MVGKIDCICNVLEEINEFYSITEFEKFQRYIEGFVNRGDLIEVPVTKPYAGFPEQWYKCKSCSQVWRLVYPDFPFKGIWRVVK
jgi:hypothetical protein